MTAENIDVAATTEAVGGIDAGAVVTFAGVVRRRGHHLDDVVRLEYEAYIEMAEAVLADIAQEIERAWPGTRVAIHHRVGSLAVGETAVAIAVAAPHRGPAFEACRAAIDRIKERAPIWKKEIGERGEAWVGFGS
jgi:molybdopterin synthase catalytic subunit